MFSHKPDPELQRQIDELRALIPAGLREVLDAVVRDVTNAVNMGHRNSQEWADLDARVRRLQDDLAAVEQKLDEVLAAQDAKARSIPTEEAKPEEANVMPGHIPWSKRKALRTTGHRSQEFINRVTKSAAPTEPKQPEAKNE